MALTIRHKDGCRMQIVRLLGDEWPTLTPSQAVRKIRLRYDDGRFVLVLCPHQTSLAPRVIVPCDDVKLAEIGVQGGDCLELLPREECVICDHCHDAYIVGPEDFSTTSYTINCHTVEIRPEPVLRPGWRQIGKEKTLLSSQTTTSPRYYCSDECHFGELVYNVQRKINMLRRQRYGADTPGGFAAPDDIMVIQRAIRLCIANEDLRQFALAADVVGVHAISSCAYQLLRREEGTDSQRTAPTCDLHPHS